MIAAVIGVLALVGSIVYWMSGSDSGLSEADAAAGKAEIAGVERPPAAAKLSLSAAPTKNLWSYPPGPDSGAYSSVMGGDSKTVIVNLKKSMIALDAENGAPLWQQPLPASFGMAAHCVVGTSGGAALCRGGKEAVLLDMRSGATKASMSADTGVAQVYAGSGLLAFAANKKNLTVFDDAGQQLWTKPITGLASVYLDQGVVAEEVGGTSTKFYDAKSGADLFSIGAVDDLIATSRGIVVSVRGRGRQNSDRFPEQQIDFYSFTGKLAWRIPADRGYRLPDTSLNSTPSFPSSVEYATSGVALPIVYSEGKGEIAAVEPLTGDFKWSQRVPLSPKPSVRLAGVGNLCIVAYGEVGSDTGGVRVRDCTDGTGAFIEKAKLDELVAADNNQIVGRHDGGPTIAYDTATGQPSWQLGDDVGSVTWVGAGLYGNGRGKITRLS
ncbi:PQQ-binding-like beta-propeller repeat protein [Mycobacterium sp. E802]|uniref:outer membrane protein assembly factor BamB family protein n=1 Tax=Mycobacterium sp. E802 TaxID=1834152 RepID=UPI001E4DF0D3|nr:PQQ-binding-like beta-propeller repeat protein [Mycobacterium sp. E802]